MVFTASHSCYANVVIDYLDPSGQYIQHRLYREHCLPTSGMNVKDLRIINRDMRSMVLVDNAAYSYVYQLDNAIPIIPYYSGKQDYELKALEKYLKSLAEVEDVRETNYSTFRLRDYYNYGNEEAAELVSDLYLYK